MSLPPPEFRPLMTTPPPPPTLLLDLMGGVALPLPRGETDSRLRSAPLPLVFMDLRALLPPLEVADLLLARMAALLSDSSVRCEACWRHFARRFLNQTCSGKGKICI